MAANSSSKNFVTEYLTEEDVKLIVMKHGIANEGVVIESYCVDNASEKMLGFLCDYWKLEVRLGPQNNVLRYFLKVVSVTNSAKAQMVKEMKLFEKELYFYDVVKQRIEIPGLKAWSAGFVTYLGNAMVFEDMNCLKYKVNDKFDRFDMAHTLEALRTLSRFHASSIIFEERKSKELKRKYRLSEDFKEQLGEAGYVNTDIWFLECMNANLEAIKHFSNYSEQEIKLIERKLFYVWSSALTLADPSTEYRNVICHRDLWNNNLMFHYKKTVDGMKPDDCILVDFQAARYQPPSGDVMLLLYCNLDPNFRESNMEFFLNFYFEELCKILIYYGINSGVIIRDSFFESAEKQRLWAVVVCACLLPQFWIDDEFSTEIFCDTAQFHDIMTKNKAAFVIKMMRSNADYKSKVLEVFEEIANRYCLK